MNGWHIVAGITAMVIATWAVVALAIYLLLGVIA